MKKLLIVAAFAMSSSAFACPNLAGTFVCQMDGQAVTTTITQSMVGGVVSYDINQEGNAWSTIITDGVERDFTGLSGIQDARYVATCQDASVVTINAAGKVMDNGTEVGTLALRIIAGVDQAGNLVQNVNGILSGSFGEFPIDEQNNVCQRQ